MILQILKVNILIPLVYNNRDFKKSLEDTITVSREKAEACKASSAFDSSDWFHYCFINKPIEANFQNINTPLLTDPKFRISRIELNSVVRTAVGLHQNENAVYSLQKVNQNFKIGKIRILFTQSRIAFLHITLSTTDIDGDAVLSVINTFRQIISSQPRFQYNKNVSKDKTETIEISLKELVQKVVNLQKYLLVSVCDGSIMPYVQLCMVGTGKQDEKMKFFESARTLSKRPSSKEIEDKLIYTGKEPYISRFVGDRAVCIFGDTGMCGDIDLRFLTDSGNGLAKTATENYLTVYAFLISLKLIAEKNDLENPDIEYLLNAPMKLSNEENINEFFEKCLWGSAWNLKESISFIRDNIQRSNGNAVAERLGYISDQTEENNRKLEENLEIAKRIERKEAEHIELTREINQKMDVLVEFVQNDLKEYITGERAKLKASISDVDEESNICTFTRDVSTHINKKINESGDAIVDLERRSLKMLFNDRWDFLLPTSQTSLISSGVLLKRCADIRTPDFDFSGICICATAALEAELKRVFFDGLLAFMVGKYGKPGTGDDDKIYAKWPDVLLTVKKSKYEEQKFSDKKKSRPRMEKCFTMGTLPFLFGEVRKIPDATDQAKYEQDQSKMMQQRMREYLSEVVDVGYSSKPFEAFYTRVTAKNRITCQVGDFVWKCEEIRDKYRNKAAHTDIMSGYDAVGCYQSIVRKPELPEALVLNAQITGVILELFQKIDGNKLEKFISCKVPAKSKVGTPKKPTETKYTIGQVVELIDLKKGGNGGLRGVIEKSDIEVSLSKKSLKESGIIAQDYVGKTIKVKLVRWDDNAQVYNAEWIKE